MCEKLQELVIKDYFTVKGRRPTLNEMQQELGIHYVRIHRILNGSPMRLAEYSAFKNQVEQGEGPRDSFVDLAREARTTLRKEYLEDLRDLMSRKIRQEEYFQVQADLRDEE
jgi:hypothetical protein